MNKFFIDLADSVTTLFAKGRLIVGLEDFDYTEDFVDQLYSRMYGLPIDEVVVINHGIIDSSAKSNSIKLKGLNFKESKSDREALMHILDVLKIPTYDFIEFASFYTVIQEEAIVIEQIDQKFNVIANLADRAYVEICTEDNVYDVVRAMQNKYQITKLIDLNTYVVPGYLAYFKNSDLLKDDRDALVSLTRFGFTMTEIAISSGSIKNLVFTDEKAFVSEKVKEDLGNESLKLDDFNITQTGEIVRDLSDDTDTKDRKSTKSKRNSKDKRRSNL